MNETWTLITDITSALICVILLFLVINFFAALKDIILSKIRNYFNKKLNTKKNFPQRSTNNKTKSKWQRIILTDGTEFYKFIDPVTGREEAIDLPYVKREILTPTEHEFWRNLKDKCDPYGIIICPKVRMEDFIEVTITDYKDKQSFRGRIKSRHIDFMLCDKDMNLLAGIELDDSSHDRADSKSKDAFKNQVFKAIKIPLFRVPAVKAIYDIKINEVLSQIVVTEESNEK